MLQYGIDIYTICFVYHIVLKSESSTSDFEVETLTLNSCGRRRNPDNWENLSYGELQSSSFLFDRGFTGHEHLDLFGLVNMNGRLYDPWLGRMLSPDNYVQSSTYSQNFNRYSYAVNNPLKYTDPDGELFWIIPNISWSKEGGLSVGVSAVLGIPGGVSLQAGVGYNFKSDEPYAYAGATLAFNTIYTSYSPSGGWNTGYTFGLSLYSGLPISTNITTVGANYNITNNSLSGNLSAMYLDENGWTFNPSVSAMVLPEQTTNFVRRQGFRSNDGVLSRFVAAGEYKKALDYFGFEGKYDNSIINPGATGLDGTIRYNEMAFSKNYDYLKFIASEEKFHQRDILSGNYKDVDWSDPVEKFVAQGKGEWKAKMYQYRNQGLFPKSGEDIIKSINSYGINAGYYYSPESFFKVKLWHSIYQIPRYW